MNACTHDKRFTVSGTCFACVTAPSSEHLLAAPSDQYDKLLDTAEELMRGQKRVLALALSLIAQQRNIREVDIAKQLIEAIKDQRGCCGECKEDVLDMSNHDCPALEEVSGYPSEAERFGTPEQWKAN